VGGSTVTANDIVGCRADDVVAGEGVGIIGPVRPSSPGALVDAISVRTAGVDEPLEARCAPDRRLPAACCAGSLDRSIVEVTNSNGTQKMAQIAIAGISARSFMGALTSPTSRAE
jgi:hypothetical protein